MARLMMDLPHTETRNFSHSKNKVGGETMGKFIDSARTPVMLATATLLTAGILGLIAYTINNGTILNLNWGLPGQVLPPR